MARCWPTTISSDDRRRVTVNTGTRRGRDAEIENVRCIADLGAERHEMKGHRDSR